MQNDIDTLKGTLAILYFLQLNMLLLQDFTITFLDMYINKLKIMSKYKPAKRYLQFLFITAKIWKQSRWPPMNECINKLQCVHAMEYLLAIKRRGESENGIEETVSHF